MTDAIKTRILKFPTDSAVGYISFLKDDGWTPKVKALGEIALPPGNEPVQFKLEDFSSDRQWWSNRSLAFLEDIDPDALAAITELDLNRVIGLSLSDLARLSALTGLKKITAGAALLRAIPTEVMERITVVAVDGPDNNDLERIAALSPGLYNLETTRGSITDAGLKHLRKSPRFQALRIQTNSTLNGRGFLTLPPQMVRLGCFCDIEDGGVGWLHRFKKLEALMSYGWMVNDGIKELTTCAKLEKLFILDSRETLTEESLAHLSALKIVKTLYVNNCSVSGDALEHLSRLSKLEDLSLSGNSLGSGLRFLTALSNLKRLHASQSRLEQLSIDAIGEMQNLNTAVLSDNDFSSCSLKPLAKLQHLRQLDLYRSRASEHEIEFLRQSLPECKIST